MNFLRASIFNLEHLDILWDSIGHPSIKLLQFEIAQSFCSQSRASRYITALNRTSELKVIAVCICYELPFSISSVLIYYRTQSDILVKSYFRLNLIGASNFNLECLNILWNYDGHPSKKLLSFELSTSFCFQFGASSYIRGLNWTSE